MIQKKRIGAKIKSKPASNPAKKKSIKPSNANLSSIQLTLNKVVDKLSHLDLEVGKISLDHENRILPALKGSADESKLLHQKIDDLEQHLTRKIDEGIADLKVAITGHTSKLENHEERIAALETHPA